MASEIPTETIMNMAHERGMLRVRDVTQRGIHPEYLRRLTDKGLLVRSGRGLYVPFDADLSAHHSLAAAAKRVPKGIICLLSALQFHEIGTQNPFQVWMALGRSATSHPRVDYPVLRIVHFSGRALTEGIEGHLIEGTPVRVYSPAKTVADCFKFRNKIGTDVAIEALRDCRRTRKCRIDDLWHYAQICRVANVMKPYLQAAG